MLWIVKFSMLFLNKSYARMQGQAVKATLQILLKEESTILVFSSVKSWTASWTASKCMHQLENHVQIPTTCSHVLCSGSGEELDLPFVFKLSWILQVSFFRSKDFKISWPQWRVTINYIFFAMELSDNTYQLLIVSYVLASSHDLVTVPVHRPASKGSHMVRAADSDQTGRAGPTALDC